MWTVVADSDKYAIQDHNGKQQARLPANGGISTDDVKSVMHDRAATLKDDAKTAARNENIDGAITAMVEWATIIEDMAGDQIQLPQPEQ